jgi:protein disulfide-isomerase A6
MNEKAGTFRAPGGSLNALAGVIPSLDTSVAALKSGGAAAYEELAKQAGALKGSYAEYYAKVAGKVQANAGYLEKESKRLAKMIEKGGLTPEALDDVVSRNNILRKFLADEEGKTEL